MTCRELVRRLGACVDGELSPEARAAVDAHVAGCAECAAYVTTYRKTVRVAKDACRDDDRPRADVPGELVDAILAARPKR